MLIKNLFILLFPVVIIITIGFQAMFQARYKLTEILNTTKEQLRNDTIHNTVTLSSFIEYKLELIFTQLYFHNLIMGIFQNKVMRKQVLVNPKMTNLAVNIQDYFIPDQYPPYILGMLLQKHGDRISQFSDCSKQFKYEYSQIFQYVLQQNQFADVLSRSIYFSLKQLDIRPYSFIQIYEEECFIYGYPFQYSGVIEDAEANKNPPEQLKDILEGMRQCRTKNLYYNYQCVPWYTVGSVFDGMFISFPGFNGDSEYVIGLCRFFESKNEGEEFMNRQICDTIKLEDLNNYIKISLSGGFDYFYILDRQLQQVAMHSNYSFLNLTASQTTWDSLELNYFSSQEKQNFFKNLPEKFYKGQTVSDYEYIFNGVREDTYFVGEYSKQGVPYLYVAYQIFVLDTTQEDKPFDYEERVYNKKKKYKSFYTVFNVINQDTLFQKQYQLQQDIENIHFLLLFTQVACSIVIVVYSIYISIVLVNSINLSLEILIYLLKTFEPEENMDLTILQSNLVPFNELTDLFCYEINLIYGSFKNLMHVITFRNKTNEFSQLSDGQSLLDWVFACQFFENIMRNHIFLGISYNNLGNIHFNAHRYLEACQCYYVSIIHLNYELNELYQKDETYCNNYFIINGNKIQTPVRRRRKKSSGDYQIPKRESIPFRQVKAHSNNSLFSIARKKISIGHIPQPAPMFNEAQEQQIQNQKYQDLLHLKFERQFQYIRSQKMYFLTQKNQTNLWKEQINQLKELYVLDQILQPPCYSRTIMVLLELSFCYLMKQKTRKAKALISLCLALFTQHTNKIQEENNNTRQIQTKLNWVGNKDNNYLDLKKQSINTNRIQYEYLRKKKKTNVFVEQEQIYLKVLQQTSSILQNPLIKQTLDEVGFQKLLQQEKIEIDQRKNGYRGTQSNSPSPKFNHEQMDNTLYNITDVEEIIGLKKYNLDKQRNTTLFSGNRQTSDTFNKGTHDMLLKQKTRNSSLALKQKQIENSQQVQNYLMPQVYHNKNLENQNLRGRSLIKTNQNSKFKNYCFSNDDEVLTNNQNQLQTYEFHELNSGEQIIQNKYGCQAKQNYEVINQRKSTVNSSYLIEQRKSTIYSNQNQNQKVKKLNVRVKSDQKIKNPNVIDFQLNQMTSKDDSHQVQNSNNNNFLYPFYGGKKSSILNKEEIKNKSNSQERQTFEVSFQNEELEIRKTNDIQSHTSLYRQIQIDDKSFIEKTEHNISFTKIQDQIFQNLQKEIPKDVVFSKIMLSLASLFESQGQLLQAAQIATNSLEIPTQYFALYRYESLQLINSCFSQLQMESLDLSKQINKFNQNLFLSLSIVIDYGNNRTSNQVSKILQELCQSQMKNPKDSLQIILAREYCETLVTKIYKDQYISLKTSINTIIKSLPQKISLLSKASSNNRVNLFKPLTKLLAEYQLSSLIRKNIKQNESDESVLTSQLLFNKKILQNVGKQQEDVLLNSFEMKVIVIFTDMKFPIEIIYNQEINNIFLNNSIHLVIFDINGLSLLNPEIYTQNNSFEFIHIFSQPFQLINFLSNLREISHQLEEPTFVQAI